VSQIKQIKQTITSTKKTKKITHAMQLVSTSKLAKTQHNMEKTRPYTEKIKEVIGHIAQSQTDYQHPYLQAQPVQRACMIIITSDRGLCGNLNLALFKQAITCLQKWQQQGIESLVVPIGQKGVQFFQRIGMPMLCQTTHLGDYPSTADVISALQPVLHGYRTGEIHHIELLHNQFAGLMTQIPHQHTLLPLPKEDIKTANTYQWDYIYEPHPEQILNNLLNRYVETILYQAVIENIAAEQAARMMAMRNASDNADQVIRELHLAYNKARQASITRELAEIVSGATSIEHAS